MGTFPDAYIFMLWKISSNQTLILKQQKFDKYLSVSDQKSGYDFKSRFVGSVPDCRINSLKKLMTFD